MKQYIALSGNVFRSTLEVHDSPDADDAIVLEVELKGLGEQVGDDQHAYIAFAPDAFVDLFGTALAAIDAAAEAAHDEIVGPDSPDIAPEAARSLTYEESVKLAFGDHNTEPSSFPDLIVPGLAAAE